MTTIKDVALSAKVSIKTVSRVLNRDGAVRPSTAEAVRAAIDNLHYVPNEAARSMRTGRSPTLGLLNDDVTSTPYAVKIIGGVQDACRESGMMLLICNTQGNAASTEQLARALVARKVEGIIFATRFLRLLDELPALGRTPGILVNCVAPDHEHTSVVPDDEAGSYSATVHLIELGHRDIGLVSINPAIMAATRRERGFRDAMRAHGLSVPADRVQAGQRFEKGSEPFTVDTAMAALFASVPSVTAILCGTDAIALRVCNALRDRGLSVPADVSVVGFDDFTLLTEATSPPLTSVALPYYEAGHLAVSRVRSQDGVASVMLPCPLVVRGSSAPPPGHAPMR